MSIPVRVPFNGENAASRPKRRDKNLGKIQKTKRADILDWSYIGCVATDGSAAGIPDLRLSGRPFALEGSARRIGDGPKPENRISAFHPTADVRDDVPDGPFVTRSGHLG